MIADVGNWQQRLVRYFSKNLHEQVGSVVLELRPLPSDIPVFDQHNYDEATDSLVILFKCDETPIEEKLSEAISLLLDPSSRRIAGVRVTGIREKGIHTITVAIQKNLESYEEDLREQMTQAKKWNEKLRKAGQLDVEKRKLGFFVNEIPKALPQLHSEAVGNL